MDSDPFKGTMQTHSRMESKNAKTTAREVEQKKDDFDYQDKPKGTDVVAHEQMKIASTVMHEGGAAHNDMAHYSVYENGIDIEGFNMLFNAAALAEVAKTFNSLAYQEGDKLTDHSTYGIELKIPEVSADEADPSTIVSSALNKEVIQNTGFSHGNDSHKTIGSIDKEGLDKDKNAIDIESNTSIVQSIDNPRRKFGTEGANTTIFLGAKLASTVILEDGFSAVAPGEMYRPNERAPGRREPHFVGLHNLHDTVIKRTTNPPPFTSPLHERRAEIWDKTVEAIKEALKDIPAGSHINICANSGSHSPKLESLPPWTTVPGAAVGILLVAEFRKDSDDIHPGWIQIAVPVDATEGRLLAGLRLIPTVAATRAHTFTVTNLTHPTVSLEHMNIVKDEPRLSYGCVANSWRAANLGCFFHRGGMWSDNRAIIRASFAWDGDLYGWDEAVLYTRKPIIVITGKKPIRRFDYWQPETVLEGVAWLQVVEGDKWAVRGSYQPVATRADVIYWDKNGVPENLWYA